MCLLKIIIICFLYFWLYRDEPLTLFLLRISEWIHMYVHRDEATKNMWANKPQKFNNILMHLGFKKTMMMMKKKCSWNRIFILLKKFGVFVYAKKNAWFCRRKWCCWVHNDRTCRNLNDWNFCKLIWDVLSKYCCKMLYLVFSRRLNQQDLGSRIS